MKKRWKSRVLGIVTIVILLLWIGDLIRFSSTLFLVPGDKYQDERVDVIAVLTGGQRRLKEAFTFLEKDQGKILFISGIDEGVKLDDILIANKINAKSSDYLGRIFVDRDSKSTLDNATEIRKIMEWLQAKSIVVVTSSYHMRRAMMMLDREFMRQPALDVKVYEWSVESPNFERTHWWTSFTGWEIFMSEYFKSRISDVVNR